MWPAEFGVGIIAEGIETERQLDRIRRIGIRMAQGFLSSAPWRWKRPSTNCGSRRNSVRVAAQGACHQVSGRVP